MKKKSVLIWKSMVVLVFCLHFLYSIACNTFLTWEGYLSFYKIDKKQFKTLTHLETALNHRASRYISHYTGGETGFAFFSPNVLSSSVIVVEKNHQVHVPTFSNHENEIRYDNLSSRLTRRILKRMEQAVTTPNLQTAILGKYNSGRQIDSVYNNIILKNIAVPFISFDASKGTRDTVTVKVLLYDYPSLKRYSARSQASDPEFIPLYATKISTKK